MNNPTVTPASPPVTGGTGTTGGSSSSSTATTTGGGSVTVTADNGAAPITLTGGSTGKVGSSNEVNTPEVSGTISLDLSTTTPNKSNTASVSDPKIVSTKIYDSHGNLMAHGVGKLKVDTTNLLDGVQKLKIVYMTSEGKIINQNITIKVYNYHGLWRYTWYVITNPWRQMINQVSN